MLTPFEAFARGDYLAAASHLSSEHWQYWAGAGIIGSAPRSADALVRFDTPEADFHAGITAWLDGDDERALALLRQAPGEYAANLAALIQRQPLTVLSQLPWSRRGPWDVLGKLRDPAFHLLNVSFHRDDIQNHPYADVHSLVPGGVTPDFFLSEMLEWHLIPPNIRDLGCPVIGHSSDYDIHIQAIAPWLPVFDELLVLDSVQWRDMSGLAPHARVSVFPGVFGIPDDMPELEEVPRTVDVFLSGTVLHPYHADKDQVVLQLLELDESQLRMVNGFDGAGEYYRNLAGSKICATYVRHPGGMPTRALEGLAMGCVAMVQEQNVLSLFFDERSGVIPYGTRSGSLADATAKVLARWDEYAEAGRRGAELVREKFSLSTIASRYLRFATVVAARPRGHRRGPQPSSLVQKRGVIQKGWLPSYEFGGQLLSNWAASSLARLELHRQIEESPQVLNDIARERLLASVHDHSAAEPSWLSHVTAPLERAVSAFPSALVPRLNLIRILLHFGRGAIVRRAVALLDETLDEAPAAWLVEPLDDVLPWDFCPSLFNYRRYFDVVTAVLGGQRPERGELTATILASLHYYRARYADELPGSIAGIDYAARATALDSDFAEYTLYYCGLLLDRAAVADLQEAAVLIESLAQRSARVLELLDLARRLPEELQGKWYATLLVRATRFWTATEMRENLYEPWLQSSADDEAVATHRQNTT